MGQSVLVAWKSDGQFSVMSSTFDGLFFLRTHNALLLTRPPGCPSQALRVARLISSLMKTSTARGRPPIECAGALDR